jgi:hypothetical protein
MSLLCAGGRGWPPVSSKERAVDLLAWVPWCAWPGGRHTAGLAGLRSRGQMPCVRAEAGRRRGCCARCRGWRQCRSSSDRTSSTCAGALVVQPDAPRHQRCRGPGQDGGRPLLLPSRGHPPAADRRGAATRRSRRDEVGSAQGAMVVRGWSCRDGCGPAVASCSNHRSGAPAGGRAPTARRAEVEALVAMLEQQAAVDQMTTIIMAVQAVRAFAVAALTTGRRRFPLASPSVV